MASVPEDMGSIPESWIQIFYKIVLAGRQEMRETGREPMLEELAQKISIPLKKVRRVMDISKVVFRAFEITR